MRIDISQFLGRIPRLNARKLPTGAAQVARNVNLERGTLEPIRGAKIVHTFDSDAITFIRFAGEWLGWNAVVDAAVGPVAQNRLYYTGDGAPKMRVDSTVYPLAIAAPAGAVTLTNLSTPDAGALEDVVYAYTWVTAYGEESQPSPLSAILSTSPDVEVRLSGFSATPTGRNITKKRIYRSKTSIAGTTSLLFVAEIDESDTTFDHSLDTHPMVEAIRTIDYTPPIDGLPGLTTLPNGIFAAFSGNALSFCEPFEPHAWPEKYALKVDSAIVGLAAFGSTLVVLTAQTPYIVQGTDPATMVMEKVDQNLPCLSRRGIVDFGYAAYFPSPDGLAVVTAQGPRVLTTPTFTLDDWSLLSPGSFVAEIFDGQYVFTFVADPATVYDCGDEDGVSPLEIEIDGGSSAAHPGDALELDAGGYDSAFGAQRVGMLDLGREIPTFSDSDASAPTSMYRDPSTGRLYMLIDARKIIEWEDRTTPRSVARWRSGAFKLPIDLNFGALKVDTSEVQSAESILATRIYANGVLRHSEPVANAVRPLPSGFRASEWEIEVETNMTVTRVVLAETPEEIAT
jgi:hypothetical protein